MSDSIDKALIDMFGANVYQLTQQEDSRIWSKFGRREVVRAKTSYFDRLAPVETFEKTGRYEKVQLTNPVWDRRGITTKKRYFAAPVDAQDKLRMLHMPESEYAIAARKRLARDMDAIAVEAILGTVYSEEGDAYNLANANKLVCTDGTNLTNLNIDTLRRLKYYYDANEVDEGLKKYIVCTSADIMSLLEQNEITNADYNTVRALVNGEVNEFMGFEFVRYEPVLETSGVTQVDFSNGAVGSGANSAPAGTKRIMSFCADAMMAGISQEVIARVSEMPEYHYDNQVYLSMEIGGMRMEEIKVCEILSK